MFNFFRRSNSSEPEQQTERQPEWLSEMNDNKARWFTFLDKLTEKMEELGNSAIPELNHAMVSDPDPYHRTHYNMMLGIKGQYHHIRDKAQQVMEEKVRGFFSLHIRQQGFNTAGYQLLYDFHEACIAKHDDFEKQYLKWLDRLDETGIEDLEGRYQQILDEHERIKDQFKCKQCGAQLSLPKLFFINAYISCPYCQTQNVFQPSIQAKQLEQIGRSLAEQRTKHLLQAYEEDRNPADYEHYLRAMFDEWNKIVPDLSEQNEKFYQRMLADFRRHQY